MLQRERLRNKLHQTWTTYEQLCERRYKKCHLWPSQAKSLQNVNLVIYCIYNCNIIGIWFDREESTLVLFRIAEHFVERQCFVKSINRKCTGCGQVKSWPFWVWILDLLRDVYFRLHNFIISLILATKTNTQ